jgi:hypothetical protein
MASSARKKTLHSTHQARWKPEDWTDTMANRRCLTLVLTPDPLPPPKLLRMLKSLTLPRAVRCPSRTLSRRS